MKRLVCALALLAFAACAAFASEPAKESLTVSGGPSELAVLKEVAAKLQKANPKLRFSFEQTEADASVKGVSAGKYDIGGTDRKLTPTERRTNGLIVFPLARDAVAVVVNPKNKVQDISFKQLGEIFSGKINNWKQLGGPDQPINLYVREKSSGTHRAFAGSSLGRIAVEAKARVERSYGEMKADVERDVSAIGYMDASLLDKGVKALKLDGAEPTNENVKDGKYHMIRDLFITTKGEPKGIASLFIRKLESPEGKKIIEEKKLAPAGKLDA